MEPQENPGLAEDATRPDQEAILARLNALGASVCKRKQEAIDGVVASGIVQQWDEDEEHYEAIDDVNRGNAKDTKPPYQARPRSASTQSTVFVPITRPYVDAASAKVSDILLPTDERSWSLAETPIPELEDKAKGELPEEAIAGMTEAGLDETKIAEVAKIEAQEAAKILAEAKARAQKAEKRIEDWQVECQYNAELRRVIEDCCKLGSGVMKGPIPALKRNVKFIDGQIVVQEQIKPISKRISCRDLFPDPSCGESIHNGSYIWERDRLTAKQLSDLKADQDYVASQIDLCLAEGPQKSKTELRKTADGRTLEDKDLFEVWYYHGLVDKEDLEAAGCKCDESDAVGVPAVLTLVNDRVIKAALNPLDNGDFPYDVMPWQTKANMPWGDGVGRQIRTPQLIVNAATRAMLTNAGRAAGPIIARKHNLKPLDGTPELTPWKEFVASEEDQSADIRQSISILEIPDRQQSLAAIIQWALKLAEDATGMPLLLQGQVGNAPETLGGQQLANNNASTVLRRIARTFDDRVTEPHIRRYYAWLLQFGEDDEKGEFVIDAKGSTALVERDLYRQELQGQWAQMAANPVFGLDPELIADELLRVSKRVPEKFKLSEEKKAERAQQAQQPDPRIAANKEVATIKAQGDVQRTQITQQSDMAELQFKAQEAERQRAHEREMRNMEFQIEMMKFAESRGQTLDKVKADLAKETMRLNTQKELSRQNIVAKQVAKPAVEPAGRASPGKGFQQ